MKHSLNILLILTAFFLAAQIIGLLVTQAYVDVQASKEKGETVWKPLPSFGGVPVERPEMDPNAVPIFLLVGILVGTLLVWLFVRVRKIWLWKIWFFTAIIMCLYISFFSFLDSKYALLLAVMLSLLKVFRPSIIVQNFTELFVYGGLSAIFVPLLNTFSAFALIIMISLYDAYAVWKSKHMITLAKAQMKSKLFAGLLIPYKMPKFARGKGEIKTEKKIKTALLGGGDIAFPLLFAGTTLKYFGFWQSLIISLCSTIALFLLIYLGKKDKFYPAMPFIGAGCFVGYGIILLLRIL